MPTISFSFKDLKNLLGKDITLEQFRGYAPFCKAELESYDKPADEITLGIGDTNLPYMWSVEGVARLLKGVIGKEKGLPELKLEKDAKHRLIVDDSVKPVRPYICAFVAKGKKVDDYLLKQMIQLQEKLCEGYGRRRQKIAIGVYSYKQIKFPVHYKATNPESVRFTPLDSKRQMTQQEILDEHPKGKEYAWILEGKKKYPILMDNDDEVLSFPPIINSAKTGKIEPGEQDLFFEATGDDMAALVLATNIFAYALADRGFKIYAVQIDYGKNKLSTPVIDIEKMKVRLDDVKKVIGIDISETELKNLLEKARYGYSRGVVEVPAYRKDIMHAVDIIEDIAIMYGYDNIKGAGLESYTTGKTFPMTRFVNNMRDVMIGLGFQEVFSPILANKGVLYDKMCVKDFGTIEIKNPMSMTYSCVRSWILPVLMEFLSKNKHVDYPHRIFEQGLVTVRKGQNKDEISDYERLAMAVASNDANYTEARQCLDAIFNTIGVKYAITEANHDSFIEGRVARVSVNGVNVAFIGELSPKVIKNFGLEVPVAGFELNLTDLFNAINKN